MYAFGSSSCLNIVYLLRTENFSRWLLIATANYVDCFPISQLASTTVSFRLSTSFLNSMEKGSYTKWDYKFQWTEKHVSPPDLNPLGHTYDELGAAVLERLQEIWKNNTVAEEKRPKLDLYMLLCKNHDKDPVLGKFWDELHTVPDWVDWEQLARGQEFFYRYAVANLTGFALQGFVGENSVSRRLVLNYHADLVRRLLVSLKSSCVQEAFPLRFCCIVSWRPFSGFSKLRIAYHLSNHMARAMRRPFVFGFSTHRSASGS